METTTAEFALLKQEIADLRQQLKVLQRYLDVTPADPATGQPASVLLRCTDLFLFHQLDKEKEYQMKLHAQADGPSMTFYGKDDAPRLSLSVENNAAQIQLFTKEWQPAVVLGVDEPAGLGRVGVCEAGRPRAVLKATEGCGVVSVVQDDGKTRGFLRSSPAGGEVLLVNNDEKAVVKLSSEAEKGGLVAVNQPNGRPAVALTPTEHGGLVMALRKEGGVSCSMHTLEKGAALTLDPASGQSRASLLVSDGGAQFTLSNAKGVNVVGLCTDLERGSLHLRDEHGQARISLLQLDQGPSVSLFSADGKTPVSLTALEGQGLIMVRSSADALASLMANGQDSNLSLQDARGKVVLTAAQSAGKAAVHLQPTDSNNAAVSLFSGPDGGTMVVNGTDGTRRAAVGAARDGGQMVIFNDLGIERALLASVDDGGAIKLNWGGTVGLAARAAVDGGELIVNDANGHPRATLPSDEDE